MKLNELIQENMSPAKIKAGLKTAASQGWFKNHPQKDLAKTLGEKIISVSVADALVKINSKLTAAESDLLSQFASVIGLNHFKLELAKALNETE